MAKESGLGAGLFVGGYNISGDVGSVDSLSKSLTAIPMTGIDKSGVERQAGVLSGSVDYTAFFNKTNAHIPLGDLPRTDTVITYVHRLAVLGTPAASLVSKQTNYDPKRETSGRLTFTTKALSNATWVDWGTTLTASPRTDSAATNGTGVDYGASYTYGLHAYLHVMAFTGTSATIKLQQSSDNGVGDAWADVTNGAFTVVTAAPTSQRIATGNQTVERYLRVVTTGVFSNLEFVVNATVNRTDMSNL